MKIKSNGREYVNEDGDPKKINLFSLIHGIISGDDEQTSPFLISCRTNRCA